MDNIFVVSLFCAMPCFYYINEFGPSIPITRGAIGRDQKILNKKKMFRSLKLFGIIVKLENIIFLNFFFHRHNFFS